MRAPVLLGINQQTDFGVPSFTQFKDTIGATKFKPNGSRTLTTLIRVSFVITRLILDIAYHFQILWLDQNI